MRGKSLIALLLLVAVACAVSVYGQAASRQPRTNRSGAGPVGPGGGGMVTCAMMASAPPPAVVWDALASMLGLTDEQVSKLKEISSKSEESISGLRKNAANAAEALRTALFASSYDAQKVAELSAAAQKAEAAVISANVNQWTQIRAILTTDQASSLKNAMATGMGRGQVGHPPVEGNVPSPSDR